MENKKFFEEPKVYSDTVAELSKKLLEANQKLHQAEYERTEMLENISHDLRAPLTAIRSTLDYLMDNCHNDGKMLSTKDMDAMISLMDKRVKVLEELIQDLYLMTCIDSGREEFKFKRIPLFQFLEEYFFAVEMDNKYEDYDLVMDVPENMDVYVNIDVIKMTRVLDNLFTNARKYSDKGAVIKLGGDIKEDTAFFYVEDTGKGIPDESIPFIFDRTYKVAKARTPAEEASSGLGLTITKSIVNQHGGDIQCESTLGKGSKFIVFLPRVTDIDNLDE